MILTCATGSDDMTCAGFFGHVALGRLTFARVTHERNSSFPTYFPRRTAGKAARLKAVYTFFICVFRFLAGMYGVLSLEKLWN